MLPEARSDVSKFEEGGREGERRSKGRRVQVAAANIVVHRRQHRARRVHRCQGRARRNLSNDLVHRCQHRARRVPIYTIALPHRRPTPGSGPTRLRLDPDLLCGSWSSELRFTEQPPYLESEDSDLLFSIDPTTNRCRITFHAPHSLPAPTGAYAPGSTEDSSSQYILQVI